MKIVIVGHVDHGKSTLVGRLFYETDSLPDGKLEALQATCARRGVPFEWAFLMDALQAERDQLLEQVAALESTIDQLHLQAPLAIFVFPLQFSGWYR